MHVALTIAWYIFFVVISTFFVVPVNDAFKQTLNNYNCFQQLKTFKNISNGGESYCWQVFNTTIPTYTISVISKGLCMSVSYNRELIRGTTNKYSSEGYSLAFRAETLLLNKWWLTYESRLSWLTYESILSILTIVLAFISYRLCIHTDVRERLSKAGSLNEMRTISNDLKHLAQVPLYSKVWNHMLHVWKFD